MKLPSTVSCLAVLMLTALAAQAKLPAASDEAKAKAAEASAKTAHANKVASYQLCKSTDKVVANYFAQAKKEGKAVKAAEKTDACTDPGAFVYTPPAPAAGSAPMAAAAPAAAVAAKK